MSRDILNIMIVLFCFLLSGGIAEAQSFAHPGGLYTRSEFEAARKKVAAGEQPYAAAYEKLMEEAKKSLERTPEPVRRFSPPGYYKNPEKCLEMLRHLSHDAWAAYSCAIAYQLAPKTQKTQYADKTIQILEAWAKKNKACGTSEGMLLMSYAGIGFVYAAEAISDYNGWKEAERTEFKKWLRAVYLKVSNGIAGRKNNWGNWGVLGCIASHHFLNDAKGLDADIVRIREKIDHAIEADGHLPREAARGKRGIWYTYFALAPLTAACQIAANARGADLFHYKGEDGAGIEKALDYLLQYCHEPEKWPHYKKKKKDMILPRQKTWPGNLYEAMSGIYGKKEYEAWIKDARPIMVHGHHYAWSVPTLLKTVPPKEKSQK